MAIDPKLTVQQHANVPLSEVLAATAKLTPIVSGLDMIGGNTDVAHYQYFGAPGTLDKVGIVLDGTLSADATVTVAIDGTPTEPASGVVTVPTAGSGAGVATSYVPTSANELVDGAVVSLTVGGTNATATFADVTLAISYVPAAT